MKVLAKSNLVVRNIGSDKQSKKQLGEDDEYFLSEDQNAHSKQNHLPHGMDPWRWNF